MGNVLYKADVFNGKLNKQLLAAIQTNDVASIGKLVKLGANPNYEIKEDDNRRLMHIAALKGFADAATELATHGADVNARDAFGATPLHCAAWNAHPRTAERLVWHGADVDAQDIDNETPLHNAAEVGAVPILEILMENGADISKTNARGLCPDDVARTRGNPIAAKVLENAHYYMFPRQAYTQKAVGCLP